MTTDEKLDRLINVVDAHVHTIQAHDNQIGKILEGNANLLEAAPLHDGQIEALIERMAQLEQQWQAYLNTFPRQ